MFRNFEEIEKYIVDKGLKKKLVLCGAHDENALEAVVYAKKRGVVEGILIGDEGKIKEILTKMGENPSDYEIIHEPAIRESSEMARNFVRDGAADIEMKGQMPSTEYLLPIMDPFDGLMDLGSLMSEVTAFYYPDQDRILFVTDCALNINPTFEQKKQLIQNAVKLAKAFGMEKVNVAAISALESVNPQIPNTQEAAELAKLDWGEDVTVVGPFALDNALDEVTARHKGIDSPVAGHADVLLMPEICTGNVLHKSLHYFGHIASAGVICGTNKPIVFTSRSDSAAAKYNAILSAILQSL